MGKSTGIRPEVVLISFGFPVGMSGPFKRVPSLSRAYDLNGELASVSVVFYSPVQD